MHTPATAVHNRADEAEVEAMKRGKVLLLSFLVLAISMVGNQGFTQSGTVVIVTGDITANTTWTANNVYVLRGAVFVREPATLTIQPGTFIAGELATSGTLIIAQGAKIMAVGTAAAPIIFTSDQPYGPPDWPSDDRFRADWGGLIVNGRATLNVPGGVGFGEGNTGRFGGTNDADNSGALVYVRVEYAGTEFSPDNELNGIAFQGVGSGTLVDFVQVHMNLDDGIEMFGGTINLKHLVLTNIGDDSLDQTDGWRGSAQYVVVQQRGDDADRGFEWDNSAENNDLLPRSRPTVYNATLVGDPFTVWGPESNRGMLLREGTAANIRNSIVIGFKDAGLRVDQSATHAQVLAGNLIIGNTIVFNNSPNIHSASAGYVNNQWPNVAVIDPLLVDPYNLFNPDFRPQLTSPAVVGTVPVAPPPPGNTFIEPTSFIGAMGPLPTDDWTRTPVKWTTSDQGFTAFLPDQSVGTNGRPLRRNKNEPGDGSGIPVPGIGPALPGGSGPGAQPGSGGGH
jgi:hypothetical protein